MTTHRPRGTGSVTRKDGYWIAIAPQLGGRGAKQMRIATCQTRRAAELELDAWLKGSGRIVRRESEAEKRCRRKP